MAIITGYASVQTAVEAIQDGAYDYLAKPFKINDLEKIITKGLRIRKGLQDPMLIAPFMRYDVTFRIPSRIALLEGVMNVVSKTLEVAGMNHGNLIKDITLCLEEAIVNAIYHGNKLKEELFVSIILEITSDCITLTVEDEGCGFDYKPYTDRQNIQDLMSRGSHGLFLMLCLMDDLQFNEKGNAIKLIKNLADEESAGTEN